MNEYLTYLLNDIAARQSDGQFPSFRENSRLRYRRPDNNVFGTASTVFILNEILPLLPPNQQSIVNSITENARRIYPLYQNKDGLATYNFWQTRPTNHFPDGLLLNRLKHFKLPDDIDDTALIYLTTERTAAEIGWLKTKLTQHTHRQYEAESNIYSTWFGRNMPPEQDVCALCNLMYLLLKTNLPLNGYDNATLGFLEKVLLEKDFLKNPFAFARHYATVPLILYHYARLIYANPSIQLSDYKLFISELAIEYLQTDVTPMEEVLLTTVLLKLQPSHPLIQEFPLKKDISDKDFYSFIGAFLGPYQERFPRLTERWAAHALMRFNWKCPTHELALQLENAALRQAAGIDR